MIKSVNIPEHRDAYIIDPTTDQVSRPHGLKVDSSFDLHANQRNRRETAMLKLLIETAKRTGTKVGICGQGPSDFPDFAQFLVELGIDSISVTPDSLLKTKRAIAEVEKSIAAGKKSVKEEA